MKETTKYILALFGVGHLLGMSITMAMAWYVAWFSGQYACVITINDYGEALPEFFIVPICLIWGLWSFAWLLRQKLPMEDK